MAVNFIQLFGAIASALSILGVLLAGLRRVRAILQRRILKYRLHRLRAIVARLGDLVRGASDKLTEGVGWHGWAIPPPALERVLEDLAELQVDLEQRRAELRGLLSADERNERMRTDLEELVAVVREVAYRYYVGIWARYRDSRGEPVETSATGREPTVTLASPKTVREVEQMRRMTMLLLTSVSFQLGDADEAHDFQTGWPTVRRWPTEGLIPEPEVA